MRLCWGFKYCYLIEENWTNDSPVSFNGLGSINSRGESQSNNSPWYMQRMSVDLETDQPAMLLKRLLLDFWTGKFSGAYHTVLLCKLFMLSCVSDKYVQNVYNHSKISFNWEFSGLRKSIKNRQTKRFYWCTNISRWYLFSGIWKP